MNLSVCCASVFTGLTGRRAQLGHVAIIGDYGPV